MSVGFRCCVRLSCRGLHTSYSSLNQEAVKYDYDAKSIIEKQLRTSVKVPKKKVWHEKAVLEALEECTPSMKLPNTILNSPEYWPQGTTANMVSHRAYQHGKAAAEYVIRNHTNYFQDDWESENIETWLKNFDENLPGMEESNESNKKAKTEEPFYPDCVDSLEKLIENVKVEEAGAMYLRLHSTKVEVPSSILNQLLGLLAFSRCSSEELKGLAQRPSLVLPTVRRYPKDIQLLIDVFKTIETPTADHHSIMIRAYVSSGASKEAIDLYNNIVSKNLSVDVDTFNHVLHALAFLTSNPRVKLDVLYYMRKHNVQPNHVTFANLITALRYHKDETSLVRQWSKVVNEMMALKMEPGLSIYITMMTAVEKTRLPPKTKQNLHHFILDAIEGKSFKVVSDLDYFAPTVLSNLVKNDLELSKKAFRLMNKAPNSKLFVNWKMQSIFLSKILDVVVNQDRIENSWELISSVSYTHAISINMYNSRLIKAAVRDERPEYIPIFCALRVGFERFEHMASCLSAAIKLFPHADKDTVTQLKNMTEYCLNKAMACKKQEIFNAIINHCIQLAALSADVTVLLNTVQMVLQKHRSAVIRVESVTMCEDFATTVGNAGLIKRVQLLREMFESQEKVPEDNNRKLNEKRKK